MNILKGDEYQGTWPPATRYSKRMSMCDAEGLELGGIFWSLKLQFATQGQSLAFHSPWCTQGINRAVTLCAGSRSEPSADQGCVPCPWCVWTGPGPAAVAALRWQTGCSWRASGQPRTWALSLGPPCLFALLGSWERGVVAKEKPQPPDSFFYKPLSTLFRTQAGHGQAIQPWSHITPHTAMCQQPTKFLKNQVTVETLPRFLSGSPRL